MIAAITPIPALLGFFYMYSIQYSFQATGCFPSSSQTIIKTMESGERGMNTVVMTIINRKKTILTELEIKPATS